jgi:hypothetical protein
MWRGDVFSQPDAPDPVLSHPVVRELPRAHLPVDPPVHMHVEVDESGGRARAYWVENRALDGRAPVGTWAAEVSWSRLSSRAPCPLDKPGRLHAQIAGFGAG